MGLNKFAFINTYLKVVRFLFTWLLMIRQQSQTSHFCIRYKLAYAINKKSNLINVINMKLKLKLNLLL